MAYNYNNIEQKWQKKWSADSTYKVVEDASKPKFYVLDMFPYPSGAGLHVGHPLGYIASDIFTRYKRLSGFNVLHPMGFDAFGLPAEQYAIQTGLHPAETTKTNIVRYKEQMDKIGFSYDWDREVQTCDPKYYKWTQSTFLLMFNSYYDLSKDKALDIKELISAFESAGNTNVSASTNCEEEFSASEWQSFDEKKKDEILGFYRMAYLADTPVNWCPALGTVLANDEVKDGLSVRGAHPVVQKTMKQWSLRVSAYAQRLLDGFDNLAWSDSIKEVQKNWIGRSEGAELKFQIKGSSEAFEIYTTRPDTLFGTTFMVLAPESEWVDKVTTSEQKVAVEEYLEACKKKTQREREMDVKQVSGVFTGAHAVHPFTGKDIPIWIGDYVLAGYGTGAIMAVPAHDQRDYNFAKKFDIEIIPVYEGDISEKPIEAKDGICINSDFINGLKATDAILKMIEEIDKRGLGKKQVNFRLRDAIFSRQRYWGEPFPIYYKNGIPHALEESDLPLELPEIDAYLPTEDGDPPLGRASNWKTKDGHPLELSTMPGFAGSSAYSVRYMDPQNDNELCSKEANQYWGSVDLYIGGIEHATGHLIYSRFWNFFLFDRGQVCEPEPYKKLVNQGMIQGRSNYVYRSKADKNKFYSEGLKSQEPTQEIHVDVNIVSKDILDTAKFKAWRPEFKDATFVTEKTEDGREIYKCGHAVEKMSKSMFNVVNPDDIVEQYGADTLRLYEMFLGPLEQSKPWNTNGIEGVSRFLSKFWSLFHKGEDFGVSDDKATKDELKILHTAIKKVGEDMENFSFNTSVSAFMIATNDLGKLKTNKKEILEPLLILLSPFAPHMGEELWESLGHTDSITKAAWPKLDESYLVESAFNYPVSFNGKMRFLIELPIDSSKDEVEKAVMADERSVKYLEDKTVKKVIIVPKKIVNIVVG